jgi:hypothetical protein
MNAKIFFATLALFAAPVMAQQGALAQLGGAQLPEVPLPSSPVEYSALPLLGGSSNCCSSAAQCKAMTGLSAPVKAAFDAISSGKWYLTASDGTPLPESKKTVIGAYQFNLDSMSVQLTWNADPSVGLSSPGSNSEKIGGICFNADNFAVSASFGSSLTIYSAPRNVQVKASPNSVATTNDYGIAVKLPFPYSSLSGDYLISQ